MPFFFFLVISGLTSASLLRLPLYPQRRCLLAVQSAALPLFDKLLPRPKSIVARGERRG